MWWPLNSEAQAGARACNEIRILRWQAAFTALIIWPQFWLFRLITFFDLADMSCATVSRGHSGHTGFFSGEKIAITESSRNYFLNKVRKATIQPWPNNSGWCGGLYYKAMSLLTHIFLKFLASGTLITESAERRIGFRCNCRWAYFTSKNLTSNAFRSKISYQNKLGCFDWVCCFSISMFSELNNN